MPAQRRQCGFASSHFTFRFLSDTCVSREPSGATVAVFIGSATPRAATYLHVKQPVFTLPWYFKARGALLGSIDNAARDLGPIEWMEGRKFPCLVCARGSE